MLGLSSMDAEISFDENYSFIDKINEEFSQGYTDSGSVSLSMKESVFYGLGIEYIFDNISITTSYEQFSFEAKNSEDGDEPLDISVINAGIKFHF